MDMVKDCRKDDKSPVLHNELFNSHRMNREQLWNAAELAEKRKNSVVAREVEIALPVDISDTNKVSLARDFSKYLSSRYKCAIDLAVHAPDADGDQRNYHAHILMTTREIGASGLGAKWRQLNQPNGSAREEMLALRKKFEQLQNRYLEKSGAQERVSCEKVEKRDLPKKYVALPFKKYQVMRREGRVADYKEVSGLEEFTRWKSKKDLEIEDLAGEIECEREVERLEQAMYTSDYYDPVGALIDDDIQKYEERKEKELEQRRQELEERGRRAIGEFKGLAEVNRREINRTRRKDIESGNDRGKGRKVIEGFIGEIEQRVIEVREIGERRDFIKVFAERIGEVGRKLRELADGIKQFGTKVRRTLRARRVDNVKANVKGWLKKKWIQINTVPDTGRPFWENASKIEHVKNLELIQEGSAELMELKWEMSKNKDAESSLECFSKERDKYLQKIEVLEQEIYKRNKKDPLLSRINQIKLGLEERSKEVVPALNEKLKEHNLEMLQIKREADLARSIQARAELEKGEKKKFSLRPKIDQDNDRSRGKGISF
jgi:hypothetical protein